MLSMPACWYPVCWAHTQHVGHSSQCLVLDRNAGYCEGDSLAAFGASAGGHQLVHGARHSPNSRRQESGSGKAQSHSLAANGMLRCV